MSGACVAACCATCFGGASGSSTTYTATATSDQSASTAWDNKHFQFTSFKMIYYDLRKTMFNYLTIVNENNVQINMQTAFWITSS